jgi:hypothetical protein
MAAVTVTVTGAACGCIYSFADLRATERVGGLKRALQGQSGSAPRARWPAGVRDLHTATVASAQRRRRSGRPPAKLANFCCLSRGRFCRLFPIANTRSDILQRCPINAFEAPCGALLGGLRISNFSAPGACLAICFAPRYRYRLLLHLRLPVRLIRLLGGQGAAP